MKQTVLRVLGVLVMMVSMVSGGALMAEVQLGAHGADNDPNDGKPLDNATADDINKGIDQHGQGASGSAMDDAELVENQINDYVTKFQADDFPLHTDFLSLARQIKVDTKEPVDYAIGESVLEAFTKGAINNTAKDETVELPLYKNDMAIFGESATIMVESDTIVGYDDKGVQDGSPLVLYVDSNEKNTKVLVTALNGPINPSTGKRYVPNIGAGTKLYVMAPALSESEVEVAPDAAYPQPQQCYLQKKVCAISYTELFARIKKKANWNVQDLKDWELAMFRKKCTRTLLISAPSKFLKPGTKRTGAEYCYTQNGVMRQLRLGFQLPATMSVNDIVAMQRMVFSKYNNGVKEVDVYCGTKRLEALHNIDFSKHPEIEFKRQTMGKAELTVSSFKSTFGTFNFKKEQALDDIGYSEYMILFSMSKAKRFYYEKGKTLTIDHSKGEGGEVREAKSQYYIQDDCLQLTDMNSMIAGPTVTLKGATYGTLKAVVVSVSALPSTGNNGDVVYLTEADEAHGVGLYVYNNSKWNDYEGEINV